MKTFFSYLVAALLGALLGSILSEVFAMAFPPAARFFQKGFDVGIVPPATLNLRVLSLTAGFSLKLTVLSFAGLAAAVWGYWKLK